MKKTELSLKVLKFFLPKTVIIFSVFFVSPLYAAIPIQGKNFEGEAALKARMNLLSAAGNYLGTPYRYSGIDASGLDCSGLIFLSFKDGLGIFSPRTSYALFSWTERINKQELKPGDLVFFITGRENVISHVGIFAGNGIFIHSASEGPKTGVMYSSLEENYWKNTFAGAGRAIPWDAVSEDAYKKMLQNQAEIIVLPEQNKGAVFSPPGGWNSSRGFFSGGALAFSTGGFLPGSPSLYRGFASQIKFGYRGLFFDSFTTSLELRPQWDSAFGIFRLPLTLSLGNDFIQFFAGPAVMSGSQYKTSFNMAGEAGVSLTIKRTEIDRSLVSLYTEIAYQAYSAKNDHNYNPDFFPASNLRISIGISCFFLIDSN